MRAIATLALVPVLLVMTSCSSSDDDAGTDAAPSSPASTSSATEDPAYPSCDEVWVDGETLPETYEGCTSASGMLEAPAFFDCADGGKLISYQDNFWAFYGDEITQTQGEMAATDEYSAAYAECTKS